MSQFCEVLGHTIYRPPTPPPRKRTRLLEVIAVGFPRSGTESLQQALLKLGYHHTYHGWDILFEQPLYTAPWLRLAQKKWHGSPDGDVHISAEEFDYILGHSTAVVDTAASCFAAELIEAYPDAKVILNTRESGSWHRSAVETLGGLDSKWYIWVMHWFSAEFFWCYWLYYRVLWTRLFRSTTHRVVDGLVPNGKWVYNEHADMVRGLCGRKGKKVLEWTTKDGWVPLCEFLGKEIPNEPFPNTNSPAGFDGTLHRFMLRQKATATRNMVLTTAMICGIAGVFYRHRQA